MEKELEMVRAELDHGVEAPIQFERVQAGKRRRKDKGGRSTVEEGELWSLRAKWTGGFNVTLSSLGHSHRVSTTLPSSSGLRQRRNKIEQSNVPSQGCPIRQRYEGSRTSKKTAFLEPYLAYMASYHNRETGHQVLRFIQCRP
ncbi:hypothetical protein DFP72DRAFT_854113 [Ephemerocybe angulata]|uniref:Uncharacterized protein n=1 Tax=Ephemerocybe angulata TaxID=980116 RepID=A0A8H6LXK0_9AGAR|nr:hypothetical protein DFP72DRAFT_854113 [Tulosesus angulatus]